MPIRHITKLIFSAREKKQEERAWQRWLVELPQMTKETFIPFSEYFGRMRAPVITNTKPKEELYAELNEIRKQFESSPAPETGFGQ